LEDGKVNLNEINNGIKLPKMASVEAPPAVQYPRPDETIEIFSFDKGDPGYISYDYIASLKRLIEFLKCSSNTIISSCIT